MATTVALTENSRQGINFEKPPCVGLGAWLNRDLRPGCGHAYDETPVGLVVYVRNDPVNRIDPSGKEWVSWTIYYHVDYWFPGGYAPEITEYGSVDVWEWIPSPPPPADGESRTGEESQGGGLSQNQIRTNFLNQLLGDKSKNIGDRIGDKDSQCWKYLQGIIDKLGISSLSSPSDLVKHLNDATYDVMGDVNGDFAHGPAQYGPNGNIVALTTTSGFLGTGTANKVVFGAKFFDSADPGSVLIHEAFHLFSGSLIFGADFNDLSDSTLFKAAGVGSGKEFNQLIHDNCK
jgi:hypothetical protein